MRSKKDRSQYPDEIYVLEETDEHGKTTYLTSYRGSHEVASIGEDTKVALYQFVRMATVKTTVTVEEED